MFKNNIFTNPIGWAEKVVGTKLRYVYFMVVTIFVGILIIIKSIDISYTWEVAIPLCVLIFIFVVIFPLCYLRAMRKLVLGRKR